MYTVLLSGGSGMRLWPLSNPKRSKQYIKLIHRETNTMDSCSMVQRVWEQLKMCNMDKSCVITAGQDQLEILKSQLGDVPIALEPERRDTFPAVALSCAYLKSRLLAGENDITAILPVDPYTEGSFFKTIQSLEGILRSTRADLALMGVQPSYPSVKYGYIVPEEVCEGYIKVKGFQEKPDEESASSLIGEGALWNCGVFCFRIGMILDLIREYGIDSDYDSVFANYDKLPKISFDYRVLEKSDHMVAVGYQGFWKDLGTWDAVAHQMSTDTVGNAILGDGCENTQIINELNEPIVAVGLKDVVIAASFDGILVADKQHCDDLKKTVQTLGTRSMYEERRWGTIKTIDISKNEAESTLTRKIHIYDNMSSSYHYHEYRNEIWTVLRGSGELILEGSKIKLFPGKAVCIRKNQRHAVKALKDFEYIEIHVGEKTGDEDINRITFRWDEIELAQIL